MVVFCGLFERGDLDIKWTWGLVMNILIAGGSGSIGRELVKSLSKSHQVTVLGRSIKMPQYDSGSVLSETWDKLSSLEAKAFDLVINLCGCNIAASRWTPSIKQEIIQSRVQTNQRLIEWLIQQQAKPRYFSANAVGIYGLQDKTDLKAFDEDTKISATPKDFLTQVAVDWQNSLTPALEFGISVTSLRFGVVLTKQQGMLKKLWPSFCMGMGSILGDGQQIISWIHIEDVVGAIEFLINRPETSGPVNVTAPHPISQADFAKTLAQTLHRPLFLKLPATVVRLLFGEMGDSLLLQGQRVLPQRLEALGYRFLYPDCASALAREFR